MISGPSFFGRTRTLVRSLLSFDPPPLPPPPPGNPRGLLDPGPSGSCNSTRSLEFGSFVPPPAGTDPEELFPT